MKQRHLAIDTAKPETIRRAIEDLRELFDAMSSRALVALEMSSGVELQRVRPSQFRPIGFHPLAAYNADGVALGIASWVFNPTPTLGEGWYGLTVTVTSGTLATVVGELVGG